MKWTTIVSFWVLLLSISAQAESCPDFSGHYSTDTPFRISLEVTQVGCTSLKATYLSFERMTVRQMIFDGVLREIAGQLESTLIDESKISVTNLMDYSDGNVLTNHGTIYLSPSGAWVEEVHWFEPDGRPSSSGTTVLYRD